MKTNNSILFCFFGNIILQVYILNQFLFNNWINPYYYIIFILFIPTKKNHLYVVLYSFLIGLFIDIGSGTLTTSGPVHALSSLLLGYFRPKYIKIISIRESNLNDLNFYNLNFGRIISYLFFGTFFHHLTLFIFFGLSFTNILISASFSSFFTILLLTLSYYIFKK